MRTNLSNPGICLILTVLILSGCSMGQMVVRGSEPILDSGMVAMNQETDLELARDAMPANLKVVEGMLIEDPRNTKLLLFAAQGFYGYAFGFVELEDPDRARLLYRRCYDHARKALALSGVELDPETSTTAEFEAAVNKAGKGAVPAMFWTASCLGNWINLSRDNIAGIAELSSTAMLMQRVLDLDDEYYFGGAHLFFGVYYGGRSPLFGGDYGISERHFARAAEINHDKLLLADVLQAEYLDRQRLDRQSFHNHLTQVIEAPDDLAPEIALLNAIAKQRAAVLLESEDDWF